MSTRKASLVLSLFGLFAAACGTDEESQPLTEPKVPVMSENGHYSLSAEPQEGEMWPESALYSSKLALYIKPWPDPAPGEVSAARPPYKVKVNAPLAKTDERAPVPPVMPLDTEGKHWALGPLKLTAPGYWVVPIEISDDDGLVDLVELRFEVE